MVSYYFYLFKKSVFYYFLKVNIQRKISYIRSVCSDRLPFSRNHSPLLTNKVSVTKRSNRYFIFVTDTLYCAETQQTCYWRLRDFWPIWISDLWIIDYTFERLRRLAILFFDLQRGEIYITVKNIIIIYLFIQTKD